MQIKLHYSASKSLYIFSKQLLKRTSHECLTSMSKVLALYCPQGLAQVDWQGPKFTERWHHLNYFGICIRALFWQNTIAFCCCTIGNVCGHLADVCTLTFFRTWHRLNKCSKTLYQLFFSVQVRLKSQLKSYDSYEL